MSPELRRELWAWLKTGDIIVVTVALAGVLFAVWYVALVVQTLASP